MPRVRVHIRNLREAEAIEDFDELFEEEVAAPEEAAPISQALQRKLDDKRRWRAINRAQRRNYQEREKP